MSEPFPCDLPTLPLFPLERVILAGAGVSPRRIRLRRTKGWRKPPGAVVVARPSRWGNPFRVVRVDDADGVWWRVSDESGTVRMDHLGSQDQARASAVALFAEHIVAGGRYEYTAAVLADLTEQLAGRDLACWCPLVNADEQPVPCHADVLLQLANNNG